MRYWQTLLISLAVLAGLGVEMISTPVASAYPGDRRDESCAARIAAAIAATPEGETPRLPDDCVEHPGMSAIELRAAEAEMIARPYPDVVHVPYQEEVVWTRAYRRMTGHVIIYDAPNGNPIGELDAGYNYVTVINEQDGFIQINYGQWVAKSTSPGRMYRISPAWDTQPKRPRWMLAEARPSTWRPPRNPPRSSALHADEHLRRQRRGWEWYLVGPNSGFSRFASPRSSPSHVQKG